MIGIITEKMSARKHFAEALGGDKGKFNGESYLLVNSIGHIYEYLEPAKQVNAKISDKYKWNINDLPWDYNEIKWKRSKKKLKGITELIKDIKDKLSKCDEIVIGTDIDESGEGCLLAYEIILENNLQNKKISRMYFTDEEKKSIQKAFINRVKIDNLYEFPEYKMAKLRSEIDYLSQQHTVAATHFSPVNGCAVKEGRVKSIMTNEIGTQEILYNNYKETYFWQNRFKDENNITYINKDEPCYDNEKEVPNIYKQSSVTLVKTENKVSRPPLLYDTSKLSGFLGSYKPDYITKTLQNMYQDRVVTYPRTGDKNITFEQFNQLKPYINDIARIVGVPTKLLTHTKPRPSHVQDVGSHGALRPNVEHIPSSLDEIENKYGKLGVYIYKLLAYSTLAMFCEDFEYIEQTGCVTDYPKFIGKAKIPTKLGWKAILGKLEEDEEYNKQGLGKIANPFVHKGTPPRPAKPTTKWLMNQLQKFNIGTAATRVTTLADISNEKIKGQLVDNNKGCLTLTDIGKISFTLIQGTQIGNYKYTEHILNVIKEIGKGNFSLIDKTIEEYNNILLNDIEIMKANANNLKDLKVEKPKFEVKEKITFTDKTGKERSFSVKWGPHTFTEDEITKLINGDTIELHNLQGSKGSYSVKGKLEEYTFKGKKTFGFKANFI